MIARTDHGKTGADLRHVATEADGPVMTPIRGFGGCAGDAAIALEAVSVHLGRRPILRHVSTDLRYGALTGIVGPNGAGKSTMLGAMSGDVQPSAGTVRLVGQDIAAMTALQMAQLRAVMVQQQRTGFAFTVAETLAMARTPWRGLPQREQDDAAIDEAIELTELAPLLYQDLPSLSGGEAQRAALARTIAQGTDVMLLDEPIAAMDVRFQELTMRLMRARADDGAAICVVLHDLTVAAAYCDRLIVVADGGIAMDGPTDDVLQPGVLSDVYRVPIDVVRHNGQVFVTPIR